MLFTWGTRRGGTKTSTATEPAQAGGSSGWMAASASRESAVRRLEPADEAPDNRINMAGEKRDRQRVPLGGQVRGEVMVFQPMTILDISMGGAQIETAFALQLDSLHDFRLTLADRSVVVKGRIAHCHIGELTDVSALYRTGVEFVGLSEHAKEAIAVFVAATHE
jgi:hypothetical protein